MGRDSVRVPQEGPPTSLVGDLFVVRATAEDTGGAYSVTEMTVAPGGTGPHPHHHTAEEEALYVLEGELRLELEDGAIAAPAGTFAVVPRGTTHTYSNPTDRPARVLVLISPPGFEQNFAKMGKPAPRRELPRDDEHGGSR